MSNIRLGLQSNEYEKIQRKSWTNIVFSQSDDDEEETSPPTVNKEGKFYKKLYAFIESKATYINLILRAKSEEDKAVPKNKYSKASRKSFQEEKEERERCLNEIKDIVKSIFPRRSDEYIDVYLKEIMSNPPKENCHLHKKLFQRNDKNMFVKHNIISYVLNFVDCKTLMKFKECSKIDNEIVSLYLRKILYSLSFKDQEIKTNIHYWKNVIDYFFFKSGKLKPIDRTLYPLVLKELEKNKSFCAITKDSMESTIFISLDYFNENLISCCNHTNPLPHTCIPTNEIQGIKQYKTENITMVDFVQEYYKRLTIIDDELMWSVCYFRKSTQFLSLLLLEYIKCMMLVLNKYKGSCIFKKTEYLVNCGHHITHRIWIQLFYEYGNELVDVQEKRKKKKKKKRNAQNDHKVSAAPAFDADYGGENDNDNDYADDDSTNNNRTLYLTIADHYKWDA
ncbi:conserved Plasmodium protein, unknown function [Plasmodium malariae]|uniref:Uncharacterized protein n=1 Tax=Plasmodium malariae TaxID=5858 RepID=A0A1C3KE80_PLAMA|nr:conserved Plasmodium protein, unknown function [Plasmodium malariae]